MVSFSLVLFLRYARILVSAVDSYGNLLKTVELDEILEKDRTFGVSKS